MTKAKTLQEIFHATSTPTPGSVGYYKLLLTQAKEFIMTLQNMASHHTRHRFDDECDAFLALLEKELTRPAPTEGWEPGLPQGACGLCGKFTCGGTCFK